MNGWCKVTVQDVTGLVITYSLEENQSCDGLLFFDKATQEVTVKSLSKGATLNQTNQFVCALRGLLRRGFELQKLYYLAVG